MTRARDTANIDTILTTKGDIYAATAAFTPARLGVGSNGQVLTANSATATGLQWASVSSALNFISLANTSFSAASSLSLSSLSASNTLLLFIQFTDGSGTTPTMTINGDSASNYRSYMAGWQSGGSSDGGAGFTTAATNLTLSRKWTTGGMYVVRLDGVGSSGRKTITTWYSSGSGSAMSAGDYSGTATVSSFTINWGTATTGNYILLGA